MVQFSENIGLERSKMINRSKVKLLDLSELSEYNCNFPPDTLFKEASFAVGHPVRMIDDFQLKAAEIGWFALFLCHPIIMF